MVVVFVMARGGRAMVLAVERAGSGRGWLPGGLAGRVAPRGVAARGEGGEGGGSGRGEGSVGGTLM